MADIAGTHGESAAIQGGHCRVRSRPQRADPLQDLLGHGDRGKAVEKERAEGHGRTEACRAPGECWQLRWSDQHDQESCLQVSVLNGSPPPSVCGRDRSAMAEADILMRRRSAAAPPARSLSNMPEA